MIGKECYAEINSTLDALLAEKKVLVAVHRGAWGGNIVENTIPSCRLCREMGGDIFECDVASSTDGVLYAFHDGTERRNLNRSDNIKTMSSQEVDSLVYNNCIYEPSGVHVERFEDIVRYFCHGEIFNIDRAWDILPQLTAALDKYPHALRQAIIKTHVVPEQLQFLNDYPTKYMYMPIVYNMDEVRQVLSYPTLNVVGMEIITDSKDSDIFQDEMPFDTASRIYKDIIFDTSPVAGKMYKNSENRRKQGVSCGFRCICRCSICPVRAQPWCARC